MSSKVISSLISNDQSFSVNFDIIDYDKSIVSSPSLNIWKEIVLKLVQEEKYNSYIFIYHQLSVKDTLESISLTYYNTTKLWWLILVANDIIDPFDFLQNILDSAEGSVKIIKPEYISKILSKNNTNDISQYLGVTNVK